MAEKKVRWHGSSRDEALAALDGCRSVAYAARGEQVVGDGAALDEPGAPVAVGLGDGDDVGHDGPRRWGCGPVDGGRIIGVPVDVMDGPHAPGGLVSNADPGPELSADDRVPQRPGGLTEGARLVVQQIDECGVLRDA